MPTRAEGGGASNVLQAFTEHVMAMGMTPSSEIAQRFANNLMLALTVRMEQVDKPYRSMESPEVLQWLEERKALSDDRGSGARLWSCQMYTDDPICFACGV